MVRHLDDQNCVLTKPFGRDVLYTPFLLVSMTRYQPFESALHKHHVAETLLHSLKGSSQVEKMLYGTSCSVLCHS